MMFQCWVPDWGHEFDDGETVIINYGTSDEAAEQYVRGNFARFEFPEEVEVAVVEVNERLERCGDERLFVVTVEQVPSFRAVEKKAPRPADTKGVSE